MGVAEPGRWCDAERGAGVTGCVGKDPFSRGGGARAQLDQTYSLMGGVKLPVGAVPGDRVGGDGVGCEEDPLDRALGHGGLRAGWQRWDRRKDHWGSGGHGGGPAAFPGDSMAATPLTVVRMSGGEGGGLGRISGRVATGP